MNSSPFTASSFPPLPGSHWGGCCKSVKEGGGDLSRAVKLGDIKVRTVVFAVTIIERGRQKKGRMMEVLGRGCLLLDRCL